MMKKKRVKKLASLKKYNKWHSNYLKRDKFHNNY